MDIVTLAASMKLNGGIAHYKNSVDILAKVLARDGAAIGGTLTLPEEVYKLTRYTLGNIVGPTTLIAPGVTTMSGPNVFTGSSYLTIKLPRVNTIIGDSPFYIAENPDGDISLWLDSLETAGGGLFSGAAYAKIYLPSLKSITGAAFGGTKLKEIYIGPNCTEIANAAFGGAGISGQTLTINCGFSEGTISGTAWYAGAVGTVSINYDVPIPT